MSNFIQNEDTCPPNTIWSFELQTCFACPKYEFVEFSDTVVEFEMQQQQDESTASDDDVGAPPAAPTSGRVVLTNREIFDVSVQLKSKPRWVTFTGATHGLGSAKSIDGSDVVSLKSAESLVLEFDVTGSELTGGRDRTAIGTISFGVEDGGSYPGCRGSDATFDVSLRVTPEDDLNHLGLIRYVGVALMAIVFTTALFSASWVFKYRNTRVVKVMQPIFLWSVCGGVFVLAGAIAPMSVDDGVASLRRCSFACMLIPWLVSIGFTVSFAALFSKLWRINRLFNESIGLQRVVVRLRDVLTPFLVLFTLNLAFLLAWTFGDPLHWERFSVRGEAWNTYGACVGGTLSKVMLGLVGLVNCGALFLACSQGNIVMILCNRSIKMEPKVPPHLIFPL